MSTKKKILIAILIILAVILIGIIIWWNVIRAMGKKAIIDNADSAAPVIITEETAQVSEEEKETWEEGWVKYNDKIYEYNEDIMTFLIMGIDKNEEVKEVAEGTNGGQADALFLLVIDKTKEKIDIIGINRNTMADVDIYNESGDYVNTVKAQICTQHGFGNGVEESCEYQVSAVSKLMYQLPIHGYAAINMKAVSIINDTVGGVSLEVLNDVKRYGSEKIVFKQGDVVHLMGDDAYNYIHDRSAVDFGAADERLARQKQYLTLFMAQAKAAIKEDSGIVSKLYNDIKPYMVTSLTFDEIAYLAPVVAGYELDIDGIRTLEGENVQGEVYEEFYPDEDKLYELLIDVFYREVE